MYKGLGQNLTKLSDMSLVYFSVINPDAFFLLTEIS